MGTAALSINAAGVAGYYQDACTAFHGFVRDPSGAMTIFNAPGAGTRSGDGTFILSIDTAGIVAGRYLDATNVYHASCMAPNMAPKPRSMLRAQALTPSRTPAPIPSNQRGGAIAGYYHDPSGVSHGVLPTP